jgi:hypothetical protein
VVLLLGTLALVNGCAQETTPYQVSNEENFTVSVKFDANGGFSQKNTNTMVVVDSYSLAGMSGNVAIPLLAPDDPARGTDAFVAVNNGYFLAGWYRERHEAADGTMTYSGRWDFANDRLTVSAEGTYSAEEPVLTLYAAWVPMFRIDFYSLRDNALLGSYSYNPNETQVQVPQWNTDSGAIDMYRFPTVSGFTFDGAYYDAAGTEKVDGELVVHPGVVDYETGTAENAVMDLYVDYLEGEWYHIYNVEQFLDNASVSGSYVIHADLDFTGEIWPTALMHGSFAGTIQGNGHTFSNIEVTQTNNSKTYAGLFGYLTENAAISDLHLENVTFTIKAGTRVAGTTYGLLAGSVSADAKITGLTIGNSTLAVDSGCYFGTDDYAIGLVSGMGAPADVDCSGIATQVVGADPGRIVIHTDGNTVTLEFVS